MKFILIVFFLWSAVIPQPQQPVMPEGPVKKRKTSHGAAVASKSRVKIIPEIANLSKKSKKSKKVVPVPVVGELESEEEKEEEGDKKEEKEEEEEEEAVLVGEKTEASKNAPESAAVELVVKTFKELVSSFLILTGNKLLIRMCRRV